jgi:hypothetical protein
MSQPSKNPVTRRHFLQGLAVASAAATFSPLARGHSVGTAAARGARELKADVLIIGASLGGVAPPPAWARMSS